MQTDAKIMPTLINIMQILLDTTMAEVETNTLKWTYSRTTLYRYTKSNDFVFTNTLIFMNTPEKRSVSNAREIIIYFGR